MLGLKLIHFSIRGPWKRHIFIIHSQYCWCWWPGDRRRQSISSKEIVLLLSEYSRPRTRWIKLIRNATWKYHQSKLNDISIISNYIFSLSTDYHTCSIRIFIYAQNNKLHSCLTFLFLSNCESVFTILQSVPHCNLMRWWFELQFVCFPFFSSSIMSPYSWVK